MEAIAQDNRKAICTSLGGRGGHLPGKQGMPCPVPAIRQLGKPVVGCEVESKVLYDIAG